MHIKFEWHTRNQVGEGGRVVYTKISEISGYGHDWYLCYGDS